MIKKGKENKKEDKKKKNKECERCAELLAGWQRSKADYSNLQKETDKRIIAFREYAEEELLIELFPLVDYFKHAFKKVPEVEQESDWLQGIKHIQDYLNKVLKENGVTEIETVGKEFDPEQHEVVKGIKGKIVEEVETGFKLHQKIIKPAKVVLADK